jgi:hypothetical protein
VLAGSIHQQDLLYLEISAEHAWWASFRMDT